MLSLYTSLFSTILELLILFLFIKGAKFIWLMFSRVFFSLLEPIILAFLWQLFPFMSHITCHSEGDLFLSSYLEESCPIGCVFFSDLILLFSSVIYHSMILPWALIGLSLSMNLPPFKYNIQEMGTSFSAVPITVLGLG